MGIEMDVVSMKDDLSSYKIVVAPMLYLLKEGAADNITEYVKKGGKLIASYLTGYVDEHTLCYLGGFPGDGLKGLFGLYSEEIDTLYPSQSNHAVFPDGSSYEIKDFAEILKVFDAQVMASYGEDFYGGTPVVTCRKEGKGEAWYIGARLDQCGMEKIYRMCINGSCLDEKKMPTGVEYHERTDGEHVYGFYINLSSEPVELPQESGINLLAGGEPVNGLKLGAMKGVVLKRPAYNSLLRHRSCSMMQVINEEWD